MKHEGVFCCEKKNHCKWQAFVLNHGLGWGTPSGHHPEWVKAHTRECGGALIQLVEPAGVVREEGEEGAAISDALFAIPHPGTGEWIKGLSFQDAMDKWFEGFNIPRLIPADGSIEPFETAYARVKNHMHKPNEKETP